MLDLQLTFSAIGTALGFGLIFAGIILILLENNKNFYIMIGVGFLFLFSVIPLVLTLKKYHSAEETYKRLTNNIDSAKKELLKFYIDHPEFKESE